PTACNNFLAWLFIHYLPYKLSCIFFTSPFQNPAESISCRNALRLSAGRGAWFAHFTTSISPGRQVLSNHGRAGRSGAPRHFFTGGNRVKRAFKKTLRYLRLLLLN